MIRKADQINKMDKTMFGGPGQLHANVLLQASEFADKGRLFNHCVLHTGEAIGEHQHTNEFEVYYILSGTGLYNDNGTETNIQAGDLTICYSGEKHGLKNTGSEDLVFIALILFS
ncbi:MAG: cupin domain-containing protein [Desulfovibrionaceae bacterium]|nr:cupin domain-containing protein [Desulfovibrionaceae bacterium]